WPRPPKPPPFGLPPPNWVRPAEGLRSRAPPPTRKNRTSSFVRMRTLLRVNRRSREGCEPERPINCNPGPAHKSRAIPRKKRGPSKGEVRRAEAASPVPPCSRHLLVPDAPFFHLPLERRLRHFQLLRRCRHVAVGLLQGFLDLVLEFPV